MKNYLHFYKLLISTFFFLPALFQMAYAGATFTKISSVGTELPDTAIQWSCVKNNATGQLWEVKTNDNKGITYSFDGAAAYAVIRNSVHFCGSMDWRVPTIKELNSIVDRSEPLVAIDVNYFPYSNHSFYRSSSGAMYINFSTGGSGSSYVDFQASVRLVNGEQYFDFFNYSKLDSNGNDLPDNAINWSCVRDNHSGLIWENKSIKNYFQKFTFDSASNYAEEMNSQSLCGFNDWRIPAVNELTLLVYYHGISRIDAAYFDWTVSESFWSATPYANDAAQAWIVSFLSGIFHPVDMSDTNFVRLVRGGRTFTKISASGDELPADAKEWSCVKNNVTGQYWEVKTVENKNTADTFDAASSDADQLILCGFRDWRIPTIKELNSISDKTKFEPAIDKAYFPHTLPTSTYRSSSPNITNANTYTWGINFRSGASYEYATKGLAGPARFVHGGGHFNSFDYTKLDANGHELPDNAPDWSCVRDNFTNTIWEVKTALNDSTTYTFDTMFNHVNDINNQQLCGYNDWRMPAVDELMTIVDFSTAAQAIKTTYFPNTNSSDYWSSTVDVSLPHRAWSVNFDKGRSGVFLKTNSKYVRLIRSGPFPTSLPALPALMYMLF